ncbi:MAG: helix-turn-helix transcriptional regulator [candidate division Zixibacteria bacterium]|nr:helix-turn-helix transcriptional regulator [candidate division Zixibacteria bacterium]
MMSIGQRIKELRTDRGLSQRKLAEITGINRTLIANYESDKANPTVKGLIKLTRIFNVTADYILFGKADETAIGDKELFDMIKKADSFSLKNRQLTKDILQAINSHESFSR